MLKVLHKQPSNRNRDGRLRRHNPVVPALLNPIRKVQRFPNLLDMYKVACMENLLTHCPSLWEGSTTCGQDICVSYRWGTFTVTIDNKKVHESQLGRGLDGFMSDKEMSRAAAGVLDLSKIRGF